MVPMAVAGTIGTIPAHRGKRTQSSKTSTGGQLAGSPRALLSGLNTWTHGFLKPKGFSPIAHSESQTGTDAPLRGVQPAHYKGVSVMFSCPIPIIHSFRRWNPFPT